MKYTVVLFTLLLFCCTFSLQAQRRYTYFSVGGQLGASFYQGELDNHAFEPWREGASNPFTQRSFRPAFGLQLNYHFNHHMFLRLQGNYGWIAGDDALSEDPKRRARNLSFRSHVVEASLQLVYEFFAEDLHYKYRPDWSPYVFSGLALFHFSPKAKPDPRWVDHYKAEDNPGANTLFSSSNEWVRLHNLGTEGQYLPSGIREEFNLPDPYRLTSISIPLGIGVRKRLTNKLDLRVEFSLRKTFTDYLDDVSGPAYAPPSELLKYEGETTFLFADRSFRTSYEGANPNTPFGIRDSRTASPAAFNGSYGIEARGNSNTKDWYGFFHVGITYILDSGDRCPKH